MMKDPALTRAKWYCVYLVTSDLAPSMSGQCLINAQTNTRAGTTGVLGPTVDLKGVANPPEQLCFPELPNASLPSIYQPLAVLAQPPPRSVSLLLASAPLPLPA